MAHVVQCRGYDTESFERCRERAEAPGQYCSKHKASGPDAPKNIF